MISFKIILINILVIYLDYFLMCIGTKMILIFL